MKSFHKSYIRAFVKFAQSAIDNRTFKTLSRYAIMISNKANELIQRASLNVRIDLEKLRKEIYDLGKEYIHKFGEELRHKGNNETKKK